MRRVPPVLTVVALVLLLSGCGSETKAANDYVDAVNEAQNQFAATFDRLSRQITSKSTPAQDQRTLDGFKRAVDKVVVDLRAVKVPSKVKDLHRQLVGEIAAYGDEIDKAKGAFAGRDPEAIAKAQARLSRAVTRVSAQINRTLGAINEKLRE